MTENKDDLISREALKKVISEKLGIYTDGTFNNKLLFGLIDSAPTIKTFTLADIEDQYRKGLEKGLSEWETERPQGEWLKSDIPESILAKCSICGFDCGAYTHNYCPNCGAAMRKRELKDEAESYDNAKNCTERLECAGEYKQIAEWIEDYKRLLDMRGEEE